VTNGRAGAQYTWHVARIVGNGTAEDEAETMHGAAVEMVFGSVTASYAIRLVERSAAGRAQRTAASARVACKRVRREIRALTDGDREAYLRALEVFYRVNETEGAARFGARFRNGAYFTALHNSKEYCYHDNLQFLTSHPAFGLQVEEMLLMIDASAPSVYVSRSLDARFFCFARVAADRARDSLSLLTSRF